MGQVFSGFQEFREDQSHTTTPVMEQQQQTPSGTSGMETPKGDKCRVLEVDPRSPTHDINRTPIEVNCTPKGTRTSMGENESPVSTIAYKERPKSLHQRIMEKKKPLEAVEVNSQDSSNSSPSS